MTHPQAPREAETGGKALTPHPATTSSPGEHNHPLSWRDGHIVWALALKMLDGEDGCLRGIRPAETGDVVRQLLANPEARMAALEKMPEYVAQRDSLAALIVDFDRNCDQLQRALGELKTLAESRLPHLEEAARLMRQNLDQKNDGNVDVVLRLDQEDKAWLLADQALSAPAAETKDSREETTADRVGRAMERLRPQTDVIVDGKPDGAPLDAVGSQDGVAPTAQQTGQPSKISDAAGGVEATVGDAWEPPPSAGTCPRCSEGGECLREWKHCKTCCWCLRDLLPPAEPVPTPVAEAPGLDPAAGFIANGPDQITPESLAAMYGADLGKVTPETKALVEQIRGIGAEAPERVMHEQALEVIGHLRPGDTLWRERAQLLRRYVDQQCAESQALGYWSTRARELEATGKARESQSAAEVARLEDLVAEAKGALREWQDWGFRLATPPICSDEELREKLGAYITRRCGKLDPTSAHKCDRLMGHGSPDHWDNQGHRWPGAETVLDYLRADLATTEAESECLHNECAGLRTELAASREAEGRAKVEVATFQKLVDDYLDWCDAEQYDDASTKVRRMLRTAKVVFPASAPQPSAPADPTRCTADCEPGNQRCPVHDPTPTTCAWRRIDEGDPLSSEIPMPPGPLCGEPATHMSCQPYTGTPTCTEHKCRCAKLLSPTPTTEAPVASFPALPIDADDERIVDGLMSKRAARVATEAPVEAAAKFRVGREAANQQRFRAQVSLALDGIRFPASSLYLRMLGAVYLGAGEGCEYERALEDAFRFQAKGEAGEAGDDEELSSEILERLSLAAPASPTPTSSPATSPVEAFRAELVQHLNDLASGDLPSPETQNYFRWLADRLERGGGGNGEA